jgi:hypothetical protein
MSNAVYIEIDSTYRNRKVWPDPAEFEVLISQSGRKDKLQAQDPVALSSTLSNSWKANAFDIRSNLSTISSIVSTISTGINGFGDNKTTLIITTGVGVNSFQKIENYYVGAIANNTTTSSASRITSYTWLMDNKAQITLESSTNAANGNTIVIYDPSDISDTENAFIFVPSGRIGFNAYPGCILFNETQLNYADILSYDTNTKSVKVSSITGKNWSPLSNQVFSIRKQAPLIAENYVEIGQESASVLSLKASVSTNDPETYINSYVKIGDESRLIIRYETFSGVVSSVPSTTTIVFPDTASNINGFYNNSYIQIGSQIRKIINYTVNVTKTAQVANAFSPTVSPGDLFSIRSLFLDKPFSSVVNNATKFEILLFSYDNHNPFVYTGSNTSQQEVVCYQIELVDLILPNKILNCGVGSRIAFYPYLYVELTNISGSSSGMKNCIYSNNPNVTRMVFRVPVYDVQNPIASAFVKLDGDGMVQTLKFKPNDNIFFSVRLPNGELFKTLDVEKYSPQQPNPDIQISALFGFKRL